ncbi:MAG TPA: glycosyltransferase [Nitrososphaera sp.]|nr:glycosyltransferase [Nitrososphaera sp.]
MKLLFYSDTRDFGGHEVMALEAIRYLSSLQHVEVTVAYYKGNERLRNRLAGLEEKPTLIPLDHYTQSLPSLRVLFQRRLVSSLTHLFHEQQPDVIIIVHGYIGTCAAGLVAARQAMVKVVSYLASAKKMREVGLRAATLRDLFDHRLYSLPDAFLTISEIMRDHLLRRGISDKRIAVVNNGVRLEPKVKVSRSEARKILCLDQDAFVIGLVGRINFVSKAYDVFLRSVHAVKDRLSDVAFLIVGDGPDEKKLSQMIKELSLENRVMLVPWKDSLDQVYAAIDALAIPSRSEVVPLTMLEAMSRRIPVIGNRIEELQIFLPDEWLFRADDPISVLATINHVRRGVDSSLLEHNRRLIEREYNLSDFGHRFHTSLCNVLGIRESFRAYEHGIRSASR